MTTTAQQQHSDSNSGRSSISNSRRRDNRRDKHATCHLSAVRYVAVFGVVSIAYPTTDVSVILLSYSITE
jgi:hypothetical protein